MLAIVPGEMNTDTQTVDGKLSERISVIKIIVKNMFGKLNYLIIPCN